ncbi:unnamed protein product [Brachionus calyciflorus]|uniref:UBX domain-containing protein 4 n=1 Tax=Brachionus calyciflorus TaxID=104777 RepID=A0A813VSZ7_9BILA|nr:unnamed protein product [Brachionus calyciflorus]
MEWHNEDIGAAITESKTKKLIFLVFIYDPANNIAEHIWNNETVINLCKTNCISLKLEFESQNCSFFKQIYPISTCPTTYLIGVNGKPIDVISGEISEEEFLSKLQKSIDVHNLEVNPAIEATESNEPTTSQNTNETSQESNTSEQKKSIDEKVAQAKEKLRQIQEKKRLEEEEKNRNSEMERRRLGQDILKAKREKEELEMKQLAEAKRKEKLEDELAKKRIMEKIQQDREEKQKNYAQEKQDVQSAKEAERQKLEQQKLLEKQAEAARNSNIARLQFRLVDGSSFNSQFEPNQTLKEVKDFVAQKLVEMNNNNTNFSMHSTFPKREYTDSDMSLTLRELNLAPSASLLIIPAKTKSITNMIPSPSSSSGVLGTVATVTTDIFTLFFSIFASMWGVVTGLIGIGQNNSRGSNQATGSSNQFRATNQEDSVQNLRLRNLGNNPRVRSLNDDREDDDNATWNGNSTQQM